MPPRRALTLCLAAAASLLAGCELLDPHWPPKGGGQGGHGGQGGAAHLVIEQGSLAGFTIHEPDARRNDPRAGEPSYIYLEAGRDAVRLAGPIVPDAPGLFVLEGPAISESRAGFAVTVNGRLGYVVDIQDFEEEVALARVELQRSGGNIVSAFIFSGRGGFLGGGVAHQLQIRALADGVSSPPTAPVAIEVR